MNFLRTGLLLAVLTAIFMGVGFLIGGPGGMLFAFLVAAGMNFFAWWKSDRLALSMNRAREVDARTAPEYYALVRELAGKAGLPMPRVYVMDAPQPNAFATGRNPEHAAVCATTGLLQSMSREEIAGVIAHELGHVRNRDTLTMTIAATVGGAVSMLANFAFFFGGSRDNNNPLGFVGVLVAAIVAPIAALLVQMAVSRTREYSADRASAEITGRPDWLVSALGKLDRSAKAIRNPAAEHNPAMAHLFIVNPLAGVNLGGLFASHPATADRIAALNAMPVARATTGLAPRPTALRPGSAPNTGRAPAAETPRGPWG